MKRHPYLHRKTTLDLFLISTIRSCILAHLQIKTVLGRSQHCQRMHHDVDLCLCGYFYVVVFQEVNDSQLDLQYAEAFAHAITLSQAEGDVRIWGDRSFILLAKAFWVVLVWIRKESLIAMDSMSGNVNGEASGYLKVQNGLQGVKIGTIFRSTFSVDVDEGRMHSEGL